MRCAVLVSVLVACEPERFGAGPAAPGLDRCTVALTCAGDPAETPGAACAVRVHDAGGERRYDGAAQVSTSEDGFRLALAEYAEIPVRSGAAWRVLDDGSDPGPDWREPAFDDTAWAALATPLVSEAPPITTFLRLDLALHAPDAVTTGVLGLRVDDGAAVFLDGVELLRDNLAEAAAPGTWATWPADDDAWIVAPVDPSEGVLAVEVHQSALAPDDLLFDLWLSAAGDPRSADLSGSGIDAEAWQLSPGGACDATLDGTPIGAYHLSPI
jgi:hypothetical protein